MLYANKNTDGLEELEELALLKNQVQEARLQEKLGKQNFHENLKKLIELLTDTNENTSENLTKILTEASKQNNQALESLNDKILEIMNDRGLSASYLMCPLSKTTNLENTTQFKLVKYSSSNGVND